MVRSTKGATALLCTAMLAGFVVLAGCTPLREGSSAQNFYSSGITNVNVSVAQPLTLAGNGSAWGSVPSDTNLAPFSTIDFAVFTDKTQGPVERYAHTAIVRLPSKSWQWIPESWDTPQSLLMTKTERAGKFWTIHMMPVISAKDWFSNLWLANSRQAPPFWLAKRWSSTPDDQTRIVAEYREAAPQCMQTLFAKALQDKKNENPLPKGDELWRTCREEINAFSDRADAVFTLDKMTADAPEQPLAKPLNKPTMSPNMKKLVGEAQLLDTDSSNYNTP